MDSIDYQAWHSQTPKPYKEAVDEILQGMLPANGLEEAVKVLDLSYATLGLTGEAGEVAEKVKKLIRDGRKESFRDDMLKELGDVLWYITEVGSLLDISLTEIITMNVTKLDSRAARDKIAGSGDDR